MSDESKYSRWRLILGETDDERIQNSLSDAQKQQDRMIGYLYGREYGRQKRNIRGASLDESSLTIPEWINGIHELFPQKTIERLEKDALERYDIQEMVTNPDLLKRAKPNLTLLKAVLHTKHLMNEEVLSLARDLVRKVIAEIIEKLVRPIKNPFTGRANRLRPSHNKIAKNFDAKRTIVRNLKNYDKNRRRMVIEHPMFFSRVRRHSDRWQLVIVVDQSGSMANSVIYSAISASIFWGISSLKTHLVAFDTNVVDLTESCNDPVETLMKVQLGGGTDIGHAMGYASQLVNNPNKTIVVLITDFYEGGHPNRLFQVTREMVESGVKVLGLAALDERAKPIYDEHTAQKMANLGCHVGCMTPGELAEWVGEIIQ